MPVKNFLSLFFSVLFLSLFNCEHTPTCKLGKPTPIFPDDVPSVSKRDFTEKNNISTESIEFTNGLQLEIFQDGCDYVRQEFRFRLNESGDLNDAAFWANKAAELFHFMADQSERLNDFHLWANAIEVTAPNLHLGERSPLEGSFTLKIDKIKMDTQAVLLTVELSNEPL